MDNPRKEIDGIQFPIPTSDGSLSVSGEAQLRALEDEEARTSIRGGTFPQERRMKMLKAHHIQREGQLSGTDAASPIYQAAFNRSTNGDTNPEAHVQERKNYYIQENQRLFDATSRDKQKGVRPLNQRVAGSVAISTRMKSGLDTLRRAQANYERNHASRTALEQKLESNIKKTLLIVFISALCVATLADFLSFFEIELNVLVSWLIPMILGFLVSRITAINKGGDAIVVAHASARRQLTLLQQRLRPVLTSSRNTQLLVSTGIAALSHKGHSYIATFARDTIITQLVELIPIINFLPLYIGQVVKVFVDQNIAYQKVKKLMPSLRYVHQQIDRLEQFEVTFMARQIATVVRAQQIIGVQGHQSTPNEQSREATKPSLSLQLAT